MPAITPTAASSGASALPTTKNDAASADRFLKLLVAQMQNQDPLNPMDNAQVTTQMAQIQTVNGIEKLTGTVEGLNLQFAQMQALQGASLVGREVVLPGNLLSLNAAGTPQGGIALASAADSVKVEVLNAAGHVIDTIDLGARSMGRHDFTWSAPQGIDPASGERFRVVARAGAANVDAVHLMRDRVDAINTTADTLTLELRRVGSTPYSEIKAFN